MTPAREVTSPKREDTPTISRREAICEAAVDLAAEGGNKAVTHHAIDDRLGIARGSTSYYYRTRQKLLNATILHLATASGRDFRATMDAHEPSNESIDDAAELMAKHLDTLLGTRRRHALARYALAVDTAEDVELHSALAACLFSVPAAQALLSMLGTPDPATATRDLLSLLEGLLFDRIYGTRSRPEIHAGTAESLEDLRRTIRLWLTALRYSDHLINLGNSSS
ncbi:TetR/AcrR family transcriptional regulator [Rhodococcus sp. PvR099]|jgi:TetR/AcrR family transcriptional regulator, regulator of biofilm formation and stress response|uniref:TetR/AcrR family transcriptional regulator n=1 Tax=Rhodococcus sp. PvR099 TaxID=2806602 RepID=UPI001AE364A5|nr:TetR family transcriptional regulator [Rhodococcus sp. PvR099]MBP1158330.1 AcrR family transcriptional regulator [Rhodococcus sp. PvR099]